MQALGLNQEKAELVADEIFDDDYFTCSDKTYEKLKEDFKSLAAVKPAKNATNFSPKEKDRIRVFNDWVKDQLLRGFEVPNRTMPINEITKIKQRAKAHRDYVNRYEAVSAAAKPKDFTKDSKWEDWSVTFINYLRCIPSKEGVPLSYVIRKDEQPEYTNKRNFLEEYVAAASVQSQDETFRSDADQVHVYLTNFVNQNSEAESILRVHESEHNGRKDWIALQTHYEGQGLYATDIMAAQRDLKNLHYSGERKPHMWWLEFERRLNLAFATYRKVERREVYSDQMKLRTLMEKIHCDFLEPVKAAIETKISEIPGNSYF